MALVRTKSYAQLCAPKPSSDSEDWLLVQKLAERVCPCVVLVDEFPDAWKVNHNMISPIAVEVYTKEKRRAASLMDCSPIRALYRYCMQTSCEEERVEATTIAMCDAQIVCVIQAAALREDVDMRNNVVSLLDHGRKKIVHDGAHKLRHLLRALQVEESYHCRNVTDLQDFAVDANLCQPHTRSSKQGLQCILYGKHRIREADFEYHQSVSVSKIAADVRTTYRMYQEIRLVAHSPSSLLGENFGKTRDTCESAMV
ncbi:hypothetical protein CYMTET_44327 [Cymbomonas tetramitiformis]|uniref:Uncharacterized protein n=1 Tax=Cymbomonas tetramitiformis TaxID=36881 RepID=A0AAE0C0B5_9CHLO|nr:hypothetical protein CYMTET_44327 [Cymbomonas tetramitiformis]|eukprot:gene12920-15271_t